MLQNRGNQFIMKKDAYNSRRYHEFFEGYTERITEKNGKKKIERVYTGDYYSPVLPAKERTHRKILYVFLYVLSVLLYAYLGTRALWINYSRCAGICQGFMGIVLVGLLISVAYYVTAKGEMTVSIWRSASKHLKSLSLAAAILYGVMSLGYLASVLFQGGAWEEFAKLFPFSCLGGIIMLLMYLSEMRTEYEVTKSNAVAPADGEEIEY